jgi:hypothetical protein
MGAISSSNMAPIVEKGYSTPLSTISAESTLPEIAKERFSAASPANPPDLHSQRVSLIIPDSKMLKHRLVFEADEHGTVTDIHLTQEQNPVVSKIQSSIIDVGTFEAGHIPPHAKQILTQWRESPAGQMKLKETQMRFEKGGGEGKVRVEYSDSQIDQALEVFKDVCDCSWAEMKSSELEKEFAGGKHGMKLSQFRQIINDLRFAALQEVFDKIAPEFPDELKQDANGTYPIIKDFGSVKLISDYDFAVAIGADSQVKETQICDRFDQEFQKIWHATGAKIFDSNAYTMQYRREATDPEQEAQRTNLQEEGSLLMMARTAGNWEQYKETSLAQLDAMPQDSSKLQESKTNFTANMKAKFAKVEARNARLQLNLNKEIVNLVASHSPQWASLKDQLDKGLTSPKLKEKLNEVVTKLTAKHGDLAVKASNKLYGQIKGNYGEVETAHRQLTNAKQELLMAADSNAFNVTFEKATEGHIKYLEARLSVVSDPSEKAVIDANIADLKSAQELVSRKSEKAQLVSKECLGFALKDKKLLEERKQLEAKSFQFKLKPGNHSAAEEDQLNQAIHALDRQLVELSQTRQAFLAEKGNQRSWDAVSQIDVQSDRLLVEMQTYNLEGMCFAQEAHVSEGAFAFVVENLQAGKTDVRSLNQYMQALREIGGFFLGHQSHQEGEINKLIDASKYAQRIVTNVKYMQRRANDLGLSALPVSKEAFTRLDIFFTGISKLRGNESLSQDAQVKKFHQLAHETGFSDGETFAQEELDKINGEVTQLGCALEAWMMTVPQDKANAFFATPKMQVSLELPKNRSSQPDITLQGLAATITQNQRRMQLSPVNRA